MKTSDILVKSILKTEMTKAFVFYLIINIDRKQAKKLKAKKFKD